MKKKIEFAGRLMVENPCDKLDEIANDTSEAFILAYEECCDIIRSHMDEMPKCGDCSRRKWYQEGYKDGKDTNDPNNDGWIPVSERLPEDGTYLCTLDGELVGEDVPFTGMCGIENGRWDEEGCVISWQPLPAPYKGERKHEIN